MGTYLKCFALLFMGAWIVLMLLAMVFAFAFCFPAAIFPVISIAWAVEVMKMILAGDDGSVPHGR